MNIIVSTFPRLRGLTRLSSGPAADLAAPHLRWISGWTAPGAAAATSALSRLPGPLSSQAEGSGVFQQLPWQYQQIRTKKRGMEYQPKNIKRKRTHGWIKRISTQGGIEVILRRMLKGRKSLTH
ncbi:large ribosomal subunit protein bL34m isoform X2 [Salarias fasciatus]|uniref:large ribosomal subunit protein bL34m isoform X2 n=1 Tax=Salarias fasciatus TaxID=181472 RepID=UPI001176BB21|nr:39S ribosomal protein L34, mitochondrial isoform X2 [Salarias fasciatus]